MEKVGKLTCPECKKEVYYEFGRFKKHKKDNGLVCPYSYKPIIGLITPEDYLSIL